MIVIVQFLFKNEIKCRAVAAGNLFANPDRERVKIMVEIKLHPKKIKLFDFHFLNFN